MTLKMAIIYAHHSCDPKEGYKFNIIKDLKYKKLFKLTPIIYSNNTERIKKIWKTILVWTIIGTCTLNWTKLLLDTIH